MGFNQLYYTSCEKGLNGHPGYQFNAATPGVRPDVMAGVASMTAYRPPPTLEYDVDEAVLAAAPVNLCYQPGPPAVVAQVAFVGTDYSHRFGNYFAHALVVEQITDFGRLLPIELWRSAQWTRQEVDDPALPVLARLVPGTLDQHVVGDFLSAHPGVRHLPALLTAIELAVREQERRVVVVERDADAVAHWIAAASYLLPPDTVRQMSFATYEHEPRGSRMHVIGTLAESNVDRNAFETCYLFDFVADRTSTIPVHPLAEYLVEMAGDNPDEVWRQAAELGDGSEQSLDDWYPVVLAFFGDHSRQGATVVAPWLTVHAQRLGEKKVEEIGAQLDIEGCPGDVLVRLAEATRSTGAHRFAEDVELAWVKAFVESPDGLALSPKSALARDHAVVALAERLPVSLASEAAALLHWAARSRLPVSGDVQYQTGLRAIGPEVTGEGIGAWLAPLLRDWPEVRAGIVAHLSTVVRSDLSAVVDLVSSDLAPLLGLREAPGLVTAVLVADALARRIPPTRALARITDSGFVPAEALTRLWPDGWTHHDAMLLLESVEKRLFCEPPMLEWLDSALLRPPSETGGEDFDRLCARVREEPVMDVLPRATARHITTRFHTASLVDRLVAAQTAEQFDTRMKEFISAFHNVRTGPRKAEMLSMVLDRMGELPMEWFAQLYVALGAFRKAYLDDAEPHLTARRADPVVAADLLRLAWHLKAVRSMRGAKAAEQQLQEHTLGFVRKWPRSHVRETAEVLRRHGPADLAAWFAEVSRTYAGNLVVRFVRKTMYTKGEKP